MARARCSPSVALWSSSKARRHILGATGALRRRPPPHSRRTFYGAPGRIRTCGRRIRSAKNQTLARPHTSGDSAVLQVLSDIFCRSLSAAYRHVPAWLRYGCGNFRCGLRHDNSPHGVAFGSRLGFSKTVPEVKLAEVRILHSTGSNTYERLGPRFVPVGYISLRD